MLHRFIIPLLLLSNNVNGRTCSCDGLFCDAVSDDQCHTITTRHPTSDCVQPCHATWEKQEPVYIVVLSGGCADVDVGAFEQPDVGSTFEEITESFECNAASALMNARGSGFRWNLESYDFTKWSEGSSTAVDIGTAPYGCYLDSGGSSDTLKINADGVDDGCTSTKACLCKAVCPVRMYQNQVDEKSCKSCGLTEYSLVGQKTCTMNKNICPTGTLGTNDPNKVCRECPAGFYNDEVGRHECKDPNQNIIINDCHLDDPSTCDCFQDSSDSTSDNFCKKCTIGKYSSQKGKSKASDCSVCKQGQYQDLEGSSACKGCPAAKYSDQEGMFYFV